MYELPYVHKQILENCRMLFDQEVKIISTWHNGIYTVMVLPEACSLKSIAQCNTRKILLEFGCSHLDGAMSGLLLATHEKLGQIFVRPAYPGGPSQESQIDKTAIHPLCNIVSSGDTQTEPVESSAVTSCTQTTAEEDKAGSEKAVEETVLDASNKRFEEVTARGSKIWRVVGYTSSGEPCIEEHEPDPNTGNSFASPTPNRTFTSVVGNHSSSYPVSDTRTDLTPGTSVISDSGTITLSFNDKYLPVCCAKRLGRADTEIARLRKNLEEAGWEIGTLEGDLGAIKRDMEKLEQRLLGAENRCKDQEEQIEAYEVGKGQSEITTESMSNEIASLKETIRVMEDTAEKRWRERVEQVIESLK